MARWIDCVWSDKEKTAPATEPVTTAQAKAHLLVEHTDDDTYIDSLVAAARRFVESFTGRRLISATHTLYADRFPTDAIYLPVSPVTAVTHVKYYDSSGTQQTWSADEYRADMTAEPARIFPRNTSTWPSTEEDNHQAVEVEYVCGWANQAGLPDIFKLAIYQLVDAWYLNRDGMTAKSVTSVEVGVRRLLESERTKWP